MDEDEKQPDSPTLPPADPANEPESEQIAQPAEPTVAPAEVLSAPATADETAIASPPAKPSEKQAATISFPSVVLLIAVILFVGYAVSSKLQPTGGFYHIIRYKEEIPGDVTEPSAAGALKIDTLLSEQNGGYTLESTIRLHRAYKAEGMYSKAAQVLKDGLQHEKNPVAINSLLSYLVPTLVKQGRYAEAELYARQSIKEESERNSHPLELALDYGSLGRILLKQKKWAEARDAFEKALRYRTISDTKPENWDAYRVYEEEELGAIYCQLGDWKKARPLLEEALQAHEKQNDEIASVWALDCLQHLYKAEGQQDRADECARKLAEIKESRPSEFATLELPLQETSPALSSD